MKLIHGPLKQTRLHEFFAIKMRAPEEGLTWQPAFDASHFDLVGHEHRAIPSSKKAASFEIFTFRPKATAKHPINFNLMRPPQPEPKQVKRYYIDVRPA